MAEEDQTIAKEATQLEEQLRDWGEVILAGDRVIHWEKPWYPGALVGGITLLFTLIYYLDPSVLTGLSWTVMLVSLANYLVPSITPTLVGSDKWTSEKQQRFHKICGNIVKSEHQVLGWWKRITTLKEQKPKMYFASVMCGSMVTAWIGQHVNNLFLTYLVVSALVLLPGMNQHGTITKYTEMAKKEVEKLLKKKEQDKKEE